LNPFAHFARMRSASPVCFNTEQKAWNAYGYKEAAPGIELGDKRSDCVEAPGLTKSHQNDVVLLLVVDRFHLQ
jgi:hypothetical protein